MAALGKSGAQTLIPGEKRWRKNRRESLSLQDMADHRLLARNLSVALGLVFAAPAWAASPTETLETFFGGTNAILLSTQVGSGDVEPRQAVRMLVNDIIDYREAATRALGPAWQSMTPVQQEEFVRLFAELLGRGFIAFVGSKASLRDGVQILYLEETIMGDSAAVATALLGRNGNSLDVDYLMVRRSERWVVRDVVIDGMSLVSNYRAQFNRILSTSSYPELVARMQSESPEVPSLVLAAAEPVVDLRPDRPEVAAAVVRAESAPSAVPEEVHQASRPVGDAAPRPETSRVVAPDPATRAQAARPSTGRAAAGRYWIQVGAFRREGAAAQLAQELRRQGIAASNEPPTGAPGHPAGALERVRVGPFSSHAEAQAMLPDLVSRGYAPFIATARD